MRQLVLEPLNEADALALLGTGLPRDAMSADPIAAQSLLESVGGVPLAIELLRTSLSETSEWTLADHARRYAERRGPFQLDAPVTAAIDSAYVRLDSDAQRAVRLLAAQPLPTLDAVSARALLGVTEHVNGRITRELEHTNLLQVRGGRFSLHDLGSCLRAGPLLGRGPGVRPPGSRRPAG